MCLTAANHKLCVFPGDVFSLCLTAANQKLCIFVVILCLSFTLLFGTEIEAIVDSCQDPVLVVAKDRCNFHGNYSKPVLWSAAKARSTSQCASSHNAPVGGAKIKA